MAKRSIAETDSCRAASGEQGVIQWDKPLAVRDFGNGNAGKPSMLHSNHLIEIAARRHLNSPVAELSRKNPVTSGGSSTTLHMPEDRGPTFEVGPSGDLFAQNLAHSAQADRVRRFVHNMINDNAAAYRFGTFRYGHKCISLPRFAPL